uniref:Protein RTE1-HOMOLOG isoform X1 n=2 Tax=Rhizophora mucronata TaxID=61149 RepID=A0A2P2MQD7_RHIMU
MIGSSAYELIRVQLDLGFVFHKEIVSGESNKSGVFFFFVLAVDHVLAYKISGLNVQCAWDDPEIHNMGDNPDPEQQMMIERGSPRSMQLDPKRARFPCCIVWAPLPVISWLIPFVGHMGMCREDGVILDFAGPNFVCVDNFAFGAVTRYLQINKDKECSLSPNVSAFGNEDEYNLGISGKDLLMWDDALRKGTQEFQHHSYSLFTCNCHSFVANNLNRLGFHYGGWNVVNLAVLMFLKGHWVSTGAMVRSYLPFFVISGIGLILGGIAYLTFLVFFALLLVGWFILGSYFLKDLIQL